MDRLHWSLGFGHWCFSALVLSAPRRGRYIHSHHPWHHRFRSRVMSAEAKLVELNLQLPPIPKPGGVYKPVVIVGNMAYCSGHVSVRSDGTIISGKVGSEVDQEFG